MIQSKNNPVYNITIESTEDIVKEIPWVNDIQLSKTSVRGINWWSWTIWTVWAVHDFLLDADYSKWTFMKITWSLQVWQSWWVDPDADFIWILQEDWTAWQKKDIALLWALSEVHSWLIPWAELIYWTAISSTTVLVHNYNNVATHS